MAAKKEYSEAELLHKRRRNRVIFVIVFLVLFWLFSCYTIAENKYSISSNKVSDKIRIAAVSDYHADSMAIDSDRIADRIKNLKPDIIAILGDMYSRKSPDEDIQRAVELSAKLVNTGCPVYFVPGEHDTSEQYYSSLEAAGVNVMRYREQNIAVKNSIIRIIGIDNAYYSPTFDMRNAFVQTPDTFTVVLAHIPNYPAFSSFGADLTLCGDTHGGIVRLPFGLGPVYDAETELWLPRLRHRNVPLYDKGSFEYSGGEMLVTSGLGLYPVPFRFNNRPEIMVADISPVQ